MKNAAAEDDVYVELTVHLVLSTGIIPKKGELFGENVVPPGEIITKLHCTGNGVGQVASMDEIPPAEATGIVILEP